MELFGWLAVGAALAGALAVLWPRVAGEVVRFMGLPIAGLAATGADHLEGRSGRDTRRRRAKRDTPLPRPLDRVWQGAWPLGRPDRASPATAAPYDRPARDCS